MSDEPQVNAEVSAQKQLSAIWIIPILALAMGLWMLFQYVNSSAENHPRSADGRWA